VEARRLVFRRVGGAREENVPRAPAPSYASKDGRHPAFGALKGITFVRPGVDLTEPADPDWGKVYD
jgi:hypothetical protein